MNDQLKFSFLRSWPESSSSANLMGSSISLVWFSSSTLRRYFSKICCVMTTSLNFFSVSSRSCLRQSRFWGEQNSCSWHILLKASSLVSSSKQNSGSSTFSSSASSSSRSTMIFTGCTFSCEQISLISPKNSPSSRQSSPQSIMSMASWALSGKHLLYSLWHSRQRALSMSCIRAWLCSRQARKTENPDLKLQCLPSGWQMQTRESAMRSRKELLAQFLRKSRYTMQKMVWLTERKKRMGTVTSSNYCVTILVLPLVLNPTLQQALQYSLGSGQLVPCAWVSAQLKRGVSVKVQQLSLQLKTLAINPKNLLFVVYSPRSKQMSPAPSPVPSTWCLSLMIPPSPSKQLSTQMYKQQEGREQQKLTQLASRVTKAHVVYCNWRVALGEYFLGEAF